MSKTSCMYTRGSWLDPTGSLNACLRIKYLFLFGIKMLWSLGFPTEEICIMQ